MSSKQLDCVPYLDALRPSYGWHVKYALLASYSTDLFALVAAILALAGVDDDRGSGSKVDLVNALEIVKGRFQILIQDGRLIAPRKPPKILSVLDQFICRVRFDESQRSWHPKIALVKTRHDNENIAEWRLWIGSRNLTRDMSWDAGLTLVGQVGGDGREVRGVSGIGASLASRSSLVNIDATQIRKELEGVLWQCPLGCDVDEINLFESESDRTLPEPPKDLKKLIVVSPFLNGGVISKLGRWGSDKTERLLLSTVSSLSELANQSAQPLKGFSELLALESPTFEVDEDSTGESEDEEPETRGLHAKLILAQHETGNTLWIGSANATNRGWERANAEVVAKAVVTESIAEALTEFISNARVVNLSELPGDTGVDEDEETLNDARIQVTARWDVLQKVSKEGTVLDSQTNPPHPDDNAVELSVSQLHGQATVWPRESNMVELGRVKKGEECEFVVCKLKLNQLEVRWLQQTPFEGLAKDSRDQQAISHFLDPKTFLLWIRALLNESKPGSGGGDWDEPKKKSSTYGTNGPDWWCPTLEEILKAWSRSPESIKTIDKRVSYYLHLLQQRDANELHADELKIVSDFEKTWQVIKQSLPAEQR